MKINDARNYWRYLVSGFALLLCIANWARAEASRYVIILTPDHPTYRAAAAACEKVLKEKGHSLKVINLLKDPANAAESCYMCHNIAATTSAPATSKADSGELPDIGFLTRPAGAIPADLVIALGDQAALATLKGHPIGSIVFGMVPNVLDSPLANVDEYKKRAAGVTTDIQPADQLKWLRRINPAIHHICVPHSKRSVRTAQAIKAAGAELGLTVSLIETSKDDFARAVDDLTSKNCDAVLMVADAQIYNPISIKRLLVWGIRQKRPVWAFSENFVKAGALGCLSAEPEAIGRQTASVALRILKGAPPIKVGIVYPDPVKAAYNERTAKLIDLSPSADVLTGVTIYGRPE